MAPKNDPFQIKAIVFAILGFFTVIILLNFMNGEVEFKKKKKISSVKFDTKKIKRRSIQKIKRKKVVKKKSSRSKTLKPNLNLAFASSGLDLGIDILGLSSNDSKLLSDGGNTVMTEDVVDRLPEVRYREEIPYPESARENNIKGHVVVNILVNDKGSVDKVKLLDSHPEGVFDRAVLQSVRDWSFEPAEYKGRFVSVWVKQKLKFQVN